MERPKNLQIELYPSRVVKSADTDHRRLSRRLQNEYSALSLVQKHLPGRGPVILSFSSNGNIPQIEMERLKLVSDITFDAIMGLIEDLQTVPMDSRIPTYHPMDYRMNAESKLRFLRRQGRVVGLSSREVDIVRRVYSSNLHHLETFKTVFVHGDIQSRHFATKNDRLAILDFDQAHFGNELEDWAFLSVRHPKFSEDVDRYLREKFNGNQEQSTGLKPAFLLLQIDKLLHGYFSRTYQWRGKPFDVGAKIYGRNKLRVLINRAEQLS